MTVVRLHVPQNAAITLAGNPTKGSGAIRTFRTKQLKQGQQWKNYTIRVTATVAGRQLSQERTIDVKAGSMNELRFAFDRRSVAAR